MPNVKWDSNLIPQADQPAVMLEERCSARTDSQHRDHRMTDATDRHASGGIKGGSDLSVFVPDWLSQVWGFGAVHDAP